MKHPRTLIREAVAAQLSANLQKVDPRITAARNHRQTLSAGADIDAVGREFDAGRDQIDRAAIGVGQAAIGDIEPDRAIGQHSAIIDDLAVIAAMGIDAGQHLHQGGFACAILAANGMNLARLYCQRHIIQRTNTWEDLGDPPHF